MNLQKENKVNSALNVHQEIGILIKKKKEFYETIKTFI